MGVVLSAAFGVVTMLAPFSSGGSADVTPEVAVTFRDPAIDESSGLVVRGDRVFTVNDSGDGPRLYAVDRRTGETAAETVFDDRDPEDVEALAAGRDQSLWVGDVGDNGRARGSIRLFRFVPPEDGGEVEADSYDLRYQDLPHDAEALLVHPRTEQVLVVTKRPMRGGVVYQAPKRLHAGEMHMLRPVANVPGTITDGTFLPDGRHVLLRSYGGAAVYTYPGFEQVADFELPVQEQGEGIAVGDDGRVYLSTEGERSDVLVMDLPPLSEPEPGAGPATGAAEPGGTGEDAQDRPGPEASRRYVVAAVAGSGLVALLVTASRRRSRHRR